MKKSRKMFLTCIIVVLIIIIGYNIEYSFTKIRSAFIKSGVEETFGKAAADTYPVILLHGFNGFHSKRIGEYSFFQLQKRLENAYTNKGVYTTTRTCAELQYLTKPISIRASYFSPDTITIEEYAVQLNEIIKHILSCTGAKKVDIITHSMGGIVTRYYLQTYGSYSVHKLIMIGTPNHGGLYNFAQGNKLLIEDGEGILSIDFISLSENNLFMQKLNQNETIPNVVYYTIAGNIDGKGDGVVLEQSTHLTGSQGNAVLPCGHIILKNPLFCKELYPYVKTMLKG